MKVGILGLGSYIPEKVITNHDLEKFLDTSDEWIRTRTGIVERRFANENEATSDLATVAAKRALEDANLKPQDIDLIIVGTNSPDMLYPATACLVQDKIGAAGKCAAFDLQAGCPGFVYATVVGAQFVKSGAYKHVLVIGAEVITRMMDPTDRTTYVLFGDGAGAVVLGEVEDDRGIIDFELYADGSIAEHLTLPAGGSRKPFSEEVLKERSYFTKMNGGEVFKFSVREISRISEKLLDKTGTKLEDIDWFIPHQANLRIIQAGAEKLGIPMEKVVVTIDKFGNSSAASIPISLDTIRKEGKLKRGNLVLMVSFGAGMTSGAILMRW
ncbi:beta-ketoacyl-ACP synthase III [Caldisericum sp.]|uniref:beta-ketoacyl-ACP synthase III n=1 Tax=Caldisericum sp. TaxID=2499687 RepID=UPI003D0F3B56